MKRGEEEHTSETPEVWAVMEFSNVMKRSEDDLQFSQFRDVRLPRRIFLLNQNTDH